MTCPICEGPIYEDSGVITLADGTLVHPSCMDLFAWAVRG
jgi:hypothetical protein